jgi:hypothetical protein
VRKKLDSLQDLEQKLRRHPRYTVETSTPPMLREARKLWWTVTLFVVSHILAAAAGVAGTRLLDRLLSAPPPPAAHP